MTMCARAGAAQSRSGFTFFQFGEMHIGAKRRPVIGLRRTIQYSQAPMAEFDRHCEEHLRRSKRSQ
jgi:hypothetical protein